MRVIHVVTAFPRHASDPITPWLVELVRRQRAADLDASVLAPAYRGGPPTESSEVPVERFRYAPALLETLTHDETVPDLLRRRPLRSFLVPFYVAGGIRAARRIGREAPPDVVHVHWPIPHALLGDAMRRGSGGRTAMICSFYSVEINWIRTRLPLLKPALRWSARTADGLTAISRSTAVAVEKLLEAGDGAATASEVRRVEGTAGLGNEESAPGRQVAVIPYGAALADDVSPPDRAALSDDRDGNGEGGGADRPVRVLFVGRLVERKGVEVLVRAVAEGDFARPVELCIVGAGEWEDRIRAAARDAGLPIVEVGPAPGSRSSASTGPGPAGSRPDRTVAFRGRLSDAALRAEYAAADLLVLPAVRDAKGDTEGLGVVLLEALRFERPVIGSDIGGIPDIVEHGETGLLCPPGDAKALAAAIGRLIDDPAAARELARRGRERVADRFGWGPVVEATSAAYERAVGVRRRGR